MKKCLYHSSRHRFIPVGFWGPRMEEFSDVFEGRVLLVGGGSSQGSLSVGPGVVQILCFYAVCCVMLWTSLLATVD